MFLILFLSYEKSSRFGQMGYEEDFLRYLQSIMTDVERRIRRGHARLIPREKVCNKLFHQAETTWMNMNMKNLVVTMLRAMTFHTYTKSAFKCRIKDGVVCHLWGLGVDSWILSYTWVEFLGFNLDLRTFLSGFSGSIFQGVDKFEGRSKQ